MSNRKEQLIRRKIKSSICPECSYDIYWINRNDPISNTSPTKCPKCDYPIWIICPVCGGFFRLDLECKIDPSHTNNIPISVRLVMEDFI